MNTLHFVPLLVFCQPALLLHACFTASAFTLLMLNTTIINPWYAV